MGFPEKYDIEDVNLTEKQKSSFKYLSGSIDYHIANLVRDKSHIKKCRNLYEGVRDKREFKYLEDVFGIETPLSVKMTPLIKTRIDVLLGLLLDEEFTHRVTMNDTMSYDIVEQEKRNERAERVVAAYQEQIHKNIKRVNKGEQPKEDVVTQQFMERLDTFISEEFVSSMEIAAQSLIKFYNQDPTVKLRQKLKQYFLDLLVTGEAYYRTYFNKMGSDPILEICKPENIFTNINTSHQFLSDGNTPNTNAVVHRFCLQKGEILSRYGHLMNKEDKRKIFGDKTSQTSSRSVYSGRDLESLGDRDYDVDDCDIHSQYTFNDTDVYEVHHVEWLANNEVTLSTQDMHDLQNVESIDYHLDGEKEKIYGKKAGSGEPQPKAYRLDCYEGIRIGGVDNVYLNMGKSKYSTRSIGQPYKTTLSYNGCMYNARNGRPYSLAYALRHIQNSYDICKFFRDNLIANSGVNGSRINLAGIPKVLGGDMMERLMKFMALRKQGVELIDPTEDGASLFQHYGDFDNSLPANAVQSINLVLEGLEAEADIVTGINRHMYAAAEQRDAVSNVKVGIKQTTLITKDMFELLNDCHGQMLVDLINQGRTTYKRGKRGSYIVGARQVIFDIQPENFCFTDYNIQVISTSKENAKLAKLDALVPELVGKGAISDDVLIKMTMMDSTTEILSLLNKSMAEQAAKNDISEQLSGENEQLNQQLQELTKQMEQMQTALDSNNEAEQALKNRELDIKEREINSKVDERVDRVALDTKVAKEEVKKDQAIITLEREQLHMDSGKGNSAEPRNNI